MYVCVCAYICIFHIYMYVRIYYMPINIFVYICMYVHIFFHMCMYTYVYIICALYLTREQELQEQETRIVKEEKEQRFKRDSEASKVCVCVRACMRARLRAQACVRACVCAGLFIYKYIYIYIYIYM